MRKYISLTWIIAFLSIVPMGCSEEFLDRPPEDTYVVDEWYENEEQLTLAVNALYGGVWFDYQRSFLNIGDVMAGNFHKGDKDAFYTFSVNQATPGVSDAYNSLWMAVAYSNSVIENITERSPESIAPQVKNKAIGEALVWKSMAYFYLVRGWGAVPIIESNTYLITSGEANTVYRNRTEDVYQYIVLLLTEAAELLPEQNEPGRINKYSAYGLLSKVYLTRSGLNQSGQRNQADLDKAKEFAAKVINESGISLESEYFDLFRISTGNRNPENLISWHWLAVAGQWGPQNAIQADLAVQQLTGFGDGWGTWSGPAVNLQWLFGEDATEIGQDNRVYVDERRKATMMMDGDYYPDLKRDTPIDDEDPGSPKGLKVEWDGGAVFQSPTGAWARKHIVGNAADNEAEGGAYIASQMTSLSTHVLRLADVYLIYAEAVLGNNESTNDAAALDAYNKVKERSILDYTPVSSFAFDDILTERRRELAYEGDNWFDYVRLFYYKPNEAIDRLANQERGYYSGNAKKPPITLNSQKYTPTKDDFFLPIPEVDLLKNPNLLKDPVPYEFGDN